LIAAADSLKQDPVSAFSVITVVYEIDENFWTTAESVSAQQNVPFEWIIKPAKPISEVDMSRLADLGVCFRIESREDSGIYNAMNIAMSSVRGEYCFFLNSGDRFARLNTLAEVWRHILANGKPKLVYGAVRVGDIDYTYPKQLTRFFFFKNALCHQAYFVSVDLCDRVSTFDESFRILADHDFALRHLDEILHSHCRVDFRVSTVPEMGFSARNAELRNQERHKMLRRHFPVRTYPSFHLRYALTFPALRARLFQLPWYRKVRLCVLNWRYRSVVDDA
jgi:glycosyltransferase involved in cell wall biosynthesis